MKKEQKAFTLVELIIAVAVVAVAFYTIISVFITVVPRNINVSDLAKATYLANRVIEETMVKSFASITSSPPTNFASPSNSFSYQVVVDYVTTTEPDVVYPNPTPYKRIKVRTWGGLSATVEVTTLTSIYAF